MVSIFWLGLLHKIGILNFHYVLKQLQKELARFPIEEVKKVLEICSNEAKNYYHPQVIKDMYKFKRERRKIFLLSALPEQLLILLSKDLPVDGVIGTKIDENTFESSVLPVYGKGKVFWALQKCQTLQINIEECVYYGDSISDRYLMKKCQKGIVVNPSVFFYLFSRGLSWEKIS